MNNKQQTRDQVGQCRRENKADWQRKIELMNLALTLGVIAVGLVLLAACSLARPTPAPPVVALTATPTPEMPTPTAPPDTATPLPPTHTPLPPTEPPTQTTAPSDTPVLPSDTPPPTDTPVPPTQTPLPTNTPLPPTEPPTQTPVPPTSTPVPPTRTPAPPTNTPAPPPPQFPWRGQVVNTFSNCALTRVMGLTLDRNGGIAGDIWVHFWADGWEGAWTRSTWGVNEGYPTLDDSSNWDGVLATYAKPGIWKVCVAPAEGSWDCLSPTVTAETVEVPCDTGSGGVQIVRIVFQQN
jgi:hypothetical protein